MFPDRDRDVSACCEPKPSQSIALVPQPSRIVRGDGAFTLTADTKILVDKDSADAANVGKQLAERINRSTGLKLRYRRQATGAVRMPSC